MTGLTCVPPLWIQLTEVDWPEDARACLRRTTRRRREPRISPARLEQRVVDAVRQPRLEQFEHGAEELVPDPHEWPALEREEVAGAEIAARVRPRHLRAVRLKVRRDETEKPVDFSARQRRVRPEDSADVE